MSGMTRPPILFYFSFDFSKFTSFIYNVLKKQSWDVQNKIANPKFKFFVQLAKPYLVVFAYLHFKSVS